MQTSLCMHILILNDFSLLFSFFPPLPSFTAWVISSTSGKGVLELEEELNRMRKTPHCVKSSSIRIVVILSPLFYSEFFASWISKKVAFLLGRVRWLPQASCLGSHKRTTNCFIFVIIDFLLTQMERCCRIF